MRLLPKAECRRGRHSLILIFSFATFPHLCCGISHYLFSLSPPISKQLKAIFSSLIRCHQRPLDFPNRPPAPRTSAGTLFSVHQGITNERKRKLEQQLQSIMVLNRQFEHVQNFINWAVCSKTSVPFLFSKELVRGSLSVQLV